MIEGPRGSYIGALVVALLIGAALRGAWPTADPPTEGTVGIVWHDEGAWVHNARNRALWGTWRTDQWNPMFIAPVFTALEYGAFRAFGVGTWQARTVPAASGLLAIVMLSLGLAAVAGTRGAVIGAALLATNYVFVMWNRAALMESTMTACIVTSWAAYALAERRPAAGLLAGIAVVLAWFTKASAAFFVAAIILDAAFTLLASRWQMARLRFRLAEPSPAAVKGAAWTLLGIALAAGVAVVLFVIPNWTEYRFYNWQMSVTRKPAYGIRALMDRASWIPIVHDFFTRMWLVTAVAALGIASVIARWRSARPAERLLVLWVLLGLAELVAHDSGNERRYIMFIPALIGLFAIVITRREPLFPASLGRGRWTRWVAMPVVLLLAYIVFGSVARLAFLYQVRPAVRLSAALAAAAAVLILVKWTTLSAWLSRQTIQTGTAVVLALLASAGDLAQYLRWSRFRTTENYDASVTLSRVLEPGTLVHGKLANGLSLENRIRPVFIGRGFGNYEDRMVRDDVRYILTYIAPSLGYESQRNLIREVLDAYPHRTIIMTFDVAETATGHDRAALIDKFGADANRARQTPGRAQN
jgi:4-amino-4-deoxy-L-arabinose transferase-like glycosyltransferase